MLAGERGFWNDEEEEEFMSLGECRQADTGISLGWVYQQKKTDSNTRASK